MFYHADLQVVELVNNLNHLAPTNDQLEDGLSWIFQLKWSDPFCPTKAKDLKNSEWHCLDRIDCDCECLQKIMGDCVEYSEMCVSNQNQNQIKSKSNHFYCHITTARVPWWVKFLRGCSRQCKKTKQFTYRQYIFTDCTEDNVQNTHTHTQYTQCTYKDILSYQYTVCTHSTLCTHLYIVICEGATDYTFTTD